MSIFKDTQARDLKPGDRIFVGCGWGGATVKKVYGIGDAAIPSEVYIVWDDPFTRKRVIPRWSATETLSVYPQEREV